MPVARAGGCVASGGASSGLGRVGALPFTCVSLGVMCKALSPMLYRGHAHLEPWPWGGGGGAALGWETDLVLLGLECVQDDPDHPALFLSPSPSLPPLASILADSAFPPLLPPPS